MKLSNPTFIQAANTLRSGGTLLYPTDTIWGLGCDASNADAIRRLYDLKQRDPSKSMLILCDTIEMIRTYVCDINDATATLLFTSDRPTTVILPVERNTLAHNLPAADNTVGVRVPQTPVCDALLHLLGRPLVSTSANLSGRPSPRSYADIDQQLIQSVDFCLPASYEQQSSGQASRIVKLLPDGTLQTLRG